MANFTFIPQTNPDGRSRRIPNRKACESCRLRKRRCLHNTVDGVSATSHSEGNERRRKRARLSGADIGEHRSKRVPLNKELQARDVDVRTRNPRLYQDEALVPPSHDMPEGDAEETESVSDPHFVGDLNPAARLLDEPQSPTEQQSTSPHEVGIWIHPRSGSNISPVEGTHSTPLSAQNRQGRQHRPPVSNIVPAEHVVALSDLYFTNVHPILPILNEQEYRDLLGQQKLPVALAHTVCLIAAKDNAAASHLRFLDSPDSSVPVRTFCAKLYASITLDIGHASSMKRITLMRVLGLLSLHQEGREGAEQASSHLAMACHHAQTLAIHLHRPGDTANLEMKMTFWSLWTLDRLNAAINSRPCIINDADIAIDHPKPGESPSAAFDIWFRIAQTLSRAIALYRPTNPDTVTGIELEYTGFEQLVDDVQGWHLSQTTLATLRIFFLATSILAYRLKTIKTLPVTTAARLRQQLSAIQIIRQMQDKGCLESLHPLPVVVYGVSLALSVSYQQLRYSRLVMDQEEALQDFKTSCGILQHLQKKWGSADTMASLAQKVSIELEKMPSLSLVHLDGGQALPRGANDQFNQSRDAVEITTANQESQSANEISNLSSFDGHEFAWGPEANDLFGGMDDMSWMYLAAENPLCFDSLPDLDIWEGDSGQLT